MIWNLALLLVLGGADLVAAVGLVVLWEAAVVSGPWPIALVTGVTAMLLGANLFGLAWLIKRRKR